MLVKTQKILPSLFLHKFFIDISFVCYIVIFEQVSIRLQNYSVSSVDVVVVSNAAIYSFSIIKLSILKSKYIFERIFVWIIEMCIKLNVQVFMTLYI